METLFGYQYVNFDPEQVEKSGSKIGLEKAISLFQSFPWDEQFAKASAREELKLSSVLPGIYFYKSEKHFLSIYAQDNDGFIIHYEKDNYCDDLFISNNIFGKPENLTVEGIIESFYSDSIESLINVFPKKKEYPEKKCLFEINYRKSKTFRPLLFLLIPLVMVFQGVLESKVFIVSFALVEAVILIFILPNLLLNFSYWKNDSDQSILIDSENNSIEIKKGTCLNKISKHEIVACDFVHVPYSQRGWNEYSYLRLKTTDKTFIVTHFTVDPVELLNLLKIHFKDVEVFYPSLDYEIVSEKEQERIRKTFENRKKEFLDRYSDYPNGKLIEIINDPSKYADYAIAAAKEILGKRNITTVKK